MHAAAEAVLQAFPERTACRGCGNAPVLVLAVDADGVRAAANKGYSRSAAFRRELRRIGEAGPVDLVCVRVAGADNVADGYSRDRAPTDDELASTLAVLRSGAALL